jgi:hypothetical protein
VGSSFLSPPGVYRECPTLPIHLHPPRGGVGWGDIYYRPIHRKKSQLSSKYNFKKGKKRRRGDGQREENMMEIDEDMRALRVQYQVKGKQNLAPSTVSLFKQPSTSSPSSSFLFLLLHSKDIII